MIRFCGIDKGICESPPTLCAFPFIGVVGNDLAPPTVLDRVRGVPQESTSRSRIQSLSSQ